MDVPNEVKLVMNSGTCTLDDVWLDDILSCPNEVAAEVKIACCKIEGGRRPETWCVRVCDTSMYLSGTSSRAQRLRPNLSFTRSENRSPSVRESICCSSDVPTICCSWAGLSHKEKREKATGWKLKSLRVVGKRTYSCLEQVKYVCQPVSLLENNVEKCVPACLAGKIR